MSARPDRIGCDHQAQVGQVRVETDDDRIGVVGRGEAIDPLLAEPGRGRARGHHIEALVAQLALEAAGAKDEDAADLRVVLAQVGRRRARRRDDRVGRDRAAHRRETRLVVGPVMHRVVRHVDDVIAPRRAIGEDGGDACNGVGPAVDDTIEIDEQEKAHIGRS